MARPKSDGTGKHLWIPANAKQRVELLLNLIDNVSRYENEVSRYEKPTPALINALQEQFNITDGVNILGAIDRLLNPAIDSTQNPQHLPTETLPEIVQLVALGVETTTPERKVEILKPVDTEEVSAVQSSVLPEDVLSADSTQPVGNEEVQENRKIETRDMATIKAEALARVANGEQKKAVYESLGIAKPTLFKWIRESKA